VHNLSYAMLRQETEKGVHRFDVLNKRRYVRPIHLLTVCWTIGIRSCVQKVLKSVDVALLDGEYNIVVGIWGGPRSSPKQSPAEVMG
jgi:hypothetical protein